MKHKIVCCCLTILAALYAASVFAADASDALGRAAAWEKAYNAGDYKSVAALYAADGCRMPPSQPIVHGTDAIATQLKAGMDQGVARAKIAVTIAETSGDIGYAMGTFEVSKADGTHIDHGKWMLISKKVNGTWKTQCDIWNSDMAMPAPAPAPAPAK